MGKMVFGACKDKTSLSKASVWVPDPMEGDLKRLLRDCSVGRDTPLTYPQLFHRCSSHEQSEMIKIGAFSPTTTFHDTSDPGHPKTGYRTALPIQVNGPMPLTSLIFLKNTACICPDGLHMSVRIVEKDIKLIIEQILLPVHRIEEFKRFEQKF